MVTRVRRGHSEESEGPRVIDTHKNKRSLSSLRFSSGLCLEHPVDFGVKRPWLNAAQVCERERGDAGRARAWDAREGPQNPPRSSWWLFVMRFPSVMRWRRRDLIHVLGQLECEWEFVWGVRRTWVSLVKAASSLMFIYSFKCSFARCGDCCVRSKATTPSKASEVKGYMLFWCLVVIFALILQYF